MTSDKDKQLKILLVDDEPVNIAIVEQYLAKESYNLTSLNTGSKAIDTLHDKSSDFDIILLDRVLPDMDGLEVLTAVRQNEKLRHTPVIMQTAKAQTSDVAEGIRAGAYYYLTKPFDDEMLISIIEAAAFDIKQRRIDEEELKKSQPSFGMVDQCSLRVRTLDEAKTTALYLAQLFPEPEEVQFGILELLINAVEHGNLEIGYAVKTKLLTEGTWLREIDRRLQLPENQDKIVTVSYEWDNNTISLIIKDQGKGFNWRDYIEISPDRATDNHGRGIAIASIMSFDALIYPGDGSEVKCVVETNTLESDISFSKAANHNGH